MNRHLPFLFFLSDRSSNPVVTIFAGSGVARDLFPLFFFSSACAYFPRRPGTGLAAIIASGKGFTASFFPFFAQTIQGRPYLIQSSEVRRRQLYLFFFLRALAWCLVFSRNLRRVVIGVNQSPTYLLFKEQRKGEVVFDDSGQ